MPRILFIAQHRPDRSPSQRFRFEQYLEFLQSRGYDYDFSYLISQADDKVFYAPGNLFRKAFIFIKSAFKRIVDLTHISRYDIVFVQREAFMTGSSWFEKRFSKSKARLVFDFDDAIWNHDVSEGNKSFAWLKDASKTERIIAYSDLVIAGNRYLFDYASRFNSNVLIIPTTIDTDEYKPTDVNKSGNSVVIGWSGSITTIKHFELAVPFLRTLKSKFGSRIEIRVIGDGSYRNEELGIVGKPWTKQTELHDLSSFDIGIMPIPDDDWSKGKCGLKGLQYMALAIPAVMSPVGVNSEIIQHGSNGYLASTDEEWVKCISSLIDDADSRKSMGLAARQTVIDKYSVHSQKENYLKAFEGMLAQPKNPKSK
ncbi:MAG: glycosyltransferase family 4 protein [Bacteroidota bacterium]|jgi:glycosyltransferase involved in cell wall biosynthesis